MSERAARDSGTDRFVYFERQARTRCPRRATPMTDDTAPRRRYPAPSTLKAAGRKLWTATTKVYELRADELRILEDACREVDLVDALAKQLAEGELMVIGSMGQPVVNPLVSELRQHRGVLTRLLGSLKLPDDPAGAKPSTSEQQRRAGAARWAARGA
jgi:hypothetical protein